MKETLMGNDAIAWGLIHANVEMVSGYPGTPSSEILGMVQKIKTKLKLPVYAEWATNEKVGFEVAYAGAIAGKRTAATMKQVGLNVASDALMSAAYIGNRGGFLLIAADDPGFHSSQTEQDSRVFAKFARIPVLDPATPQDAYDMTRYGVELSERFETPVMLRPVMRVCHAREIIEMEGETEFHPHEGKFVRNIPRWAAVPRDGRLKQGYEALDRIEVIAAYNWAEHLKPRFDALEGESDVLILASGTGFAFTREAMEELGVEAHLVKVEMPYPLPVEEVRKRMESYEKVLVVEEPYPCIEEQVMDPAKVHGRLDATMNRIDEMKKEHILEAFKKLGLYEGENIYAPKLTFSIDVPPRPPALCPGCPHRDIYYAIMKVFKKNKSIYPSDIGCYTLALAQGAIDTILCMGASVSMASGLSLADPSKTVVATIGDGTFFHSGIPPLINAVYQGHRFILVILDNSTIAMTGRQVTPERFNQTLDIGRIVEGMGIKCYEHTYSHEMHKNIDFFKGIKKIFESEEHHGPLVVRVRQFCILDNERKDDWIPGEYAVVDPELCVACDQCTTVYKCPPMAYNAEGKIEIDPFLCAGCGGCLEIVCPTDAFKLDEKKSGGKK
ncbi:thiamine pyrophosphate-dependent enzyme [Nitratifractor sp.]